MNAAAQGSNRDSANIRRRKPLTKARLEKLFGVHPSEFWRSFWAGVDEVDGHRLWRGKTGLVSFPKGVRIPASTVAWMWDGGRLPVDGRLAPTCGESRCVHFAHLAVR